MISLSAWADFSAQLDAAIQSHIQWSQRILRCAVLRTIPGDDILHSNSHELCKLGCCLKKNRAFFEALDSQETAALESHHREMHHAIRDICQRAVAGKPGSEESLTRFENAQTHVIEYLSHFKTLSTQINSEIDPLTGLPLRHHLEQKFELLRRRTSRHGNLVALMLIDIDHFKSVNDLHGHFGGDLVLKSIANCLKNNVREGDEAYRYGGDELLILLELRTADEALLAGRRLLNTIRKQSVHFDNGNTLQTTATIGIAYARSAEKLSDVLQRADSALYQGKARGRNCYVVAGDNDVGGSGRRLAS